MSRHMHCGCLLIRQITEVKSRNKLAHGIVTTVLGPGFYSYLNSVEIWKHPVHFKIIRDLSKSSLAIDLGVSVASFYS